MAGLTKEQRAEREAAKQAEEGSIQFVMMVRDEGKWPAPHTAQVHPDEVQNYYSGGWVKDRS